jgi:hypothetical protein
LFPAAIPLLLTGTRTDIAAGTAIPTEPMLDAETMADIEVFTAQLAKLTS